MTVEPSGGNGHPFAIVTYFLLVTYDILCLSHLTEALTKI